MKSIRIVWSEAVIHSDRRNLANCHSVHDEQKWDLAADAQNLVQQRMLALHKEANSYMC